MQAIPYTVAQNHLEHTLSQVCENHEPVIITRDAEKSVVIISLEDFSALEETAYLMSSPANAKRLLESIAELDAGHGIERELFE